jgi:phenylacetate-CoA ligase
MRWLDTEESWNWWKRCWAIIYRAAALTPDDRMLFPFSFGPFIGFWGAFESAAALGNFCLPCGGMSTIARLHYMIDHQATVVCCTPTYALRMAEVAAKEGLDLAASPVRALVVAGEPGGNVPATRHSIQRAWDARVIDHTGMTEIGPWGFECAEAGGGVHVMECEFIAEVVDPETGEAVADGETGELVLTNLGRVGSPLIRYRTGDQVRLTQGRCACGRWFSRADAGILGRIDDMLIIRGNNVFPSAVEDIIRGFDEIAEFRIQVDEQGPMLDLYVLVEATPEAEPSELPSRVAAAIRDRLHFTARVGLVEPGTLPRFEMKAQRVQRLRGSGAAGDG